jgi:serine/threonine-protein phosphatase 4 regulatory subunit 1
VAEVERVGRDPVYWVRREASFALGALAKVVPQEIVICSLVGLSYRLRRIL